MKILYEDDSCFVIDKPAGMVVHPGEDGYYKNKTVVDAVSDKIETGTGDTMRPGIVHRLDKDTSGVLIIAKNQVGYEDLAAQFQSRAVDKVYLTLVKGKMEHPEAKIDSPVARSLNNRKKMGISGEDDGKKAVTEYKVLDVYKIENQAVSFLLVRIKTGRTHQIRVHMAAIGHSVVGDKNYGNKKVNKLFLKKCGLQRQFLHAAKIKFRSPSTRKIISVHSDLPVDLKIVISSLSLL